MSKILLPTGYKPWLLAAIALVVTVTALLGLLLYILLPLGVEYLWHKWARELIKLTLAHHSLRW